jgi:formamidopyrimidine-DNA glycosylase
MRSVEELASALKRKKAPIKAVLMDQKFMSGVGNWIADECLYQARIAPARQASSLTRDDVEVLRAKLLDILRLACDVGADKDQFPADWMFHHRWEGARGIEAIEGHPIRRETIAGRTTAWVPDLQE